jgi:sterol desaturase/sphingolipid hydroxylase (fatty acid hydroxylase superfamily)
MPLTELIGTELRQLASWGYWHVIAPLLAQPFLHWMFIVSTIVAAYLFFLFTARAASGDSSLRGFARYAFPRSIWLHPSAIVDYKFYVVNQLLISWLRLGQWVIGAVAVLKVAEGLTWVLDTALGAGPATDAPPLPAVIAFTLLTAIAYDYGRFLSHFVQHRVPFLWEFHKVHHSAEVLTPISSFRAHPVDQMIEFLFRLIATAAVSGVFAHFYTGIAELTILNYSALTFFFYLTAHLRHSHVRMGFGKLSGYLISPFMHQLHHSAQHRHFDKNFGFIFSFWDRMCGTLYIPARDEAFDLGLPEDAGKYDTVTKLLVRPFVGAAQILVPQLRKREQA